MQREFYFVPLRKKRKIESEKVVTVTKTGIIRFPFQLVRDVTGIEIGKSLFVQLFCDVNKRALGFRFMLDYKGLLTKGENVRFMKAQLLKGGYHLYQLSVSTFIKALGGAEQTHKLEVKEYKDDMLGGEFFYVIIPKGKQN